MNRFKKWVPFIPVFVALILYAPTLTYEFVYDDHWTVDTNPHLRIWPGLGRALTTDIWALTDYPKLSNYYRPMFFLTNWTIAHVLSPAPWAFHLVNILLHAGVAGLVWLVSMNLVRDRRVALIAAMLFAVHPIHTEAVAWITDIVDLGCTAFFLLAVFLYTRFDRDSLATDVGVGASYLGSLLWKELGATFLPVIVAYDVVVRREFRWRRYVPIASITAVYFLLRYYALGGIVPIAYHSTMKLTDYPLIAAAGLGTYISKLILPMNLSMYYDPVAPSLGYGLLLAGVIAAALLAWRTQPQIAWALFWIALTLSPALAVSRISMPISERNLYLASAGYCWAIAFIASGLKWRFAPVLPAVLAGLFVMGTISRLPVWHDDLALYAATLDKNPGAGLIRMNLATELARRGQVPQAIEQVDIVLEANPSDVGVLSNMAQLKSRQGDWQSVKDNCSKALSVDPRMAACLTLLAATHQQQGDLAGALQKLDEAIGIAPTSYEAHYYRGNIYTQMGRLDEALAEFKLAITARPAPEAFNNLGSTYFQLKQLDAAIESYQAALKVDPAYTLAKENLNALLEWQHDHPAESSPSR